MGASDPNRPPARSRAFRLAAWLGAIAALLVLLLVVGIPVPIGAFRGWIEARASEAAGQSVGIESLALRVGFRPRLTVEGLRLAHTLEGRPDVLRAERVEVELGLAGLLRRRIALSELSVDGVAVHVDPEAFPERTASDEEPDVPTGGAPTAGWSLDVEELSLTNLTLVRRLPGAETMHASLVALAGTLLWDESLELSFEGAYRELPVSARVEGASLARLLEGAEAWPLRIDADLGGNEMEFSARLATKDDVYRIDELRGRAADTSVAGWLALENLATRPRASGRIELGTVDLALPERSGERKPLAPPGATGAAPPEDPSAPPEAPSSPSPTGDEGPSPIAVAMEMLRDFETDLELEIQRIAGFGPTVEGLSVALRLAGGALRFPVSLTADGIPLAGVLELNEVDELPHLRFELSSEGAAVDELAATLLPGAGVRGRFEELLLELEGSGSSAQGFLETLRVDLEMSDAALRYGAERPVPFRVEQLTLALAKGGPINLAVRGDLLGELVQLDLSGGTMRTFLDVSPWPLRLELAGAGATVSLSGEAVGYIDTLDLIGDLNVHGQRLSDLEPWLGTLPVPDGSYALRAHIVDTPTGTNVTLEEARLGETNLTGELGARRGEDDALLSAALRIERLDLSPYLEAAQSGSPATEATEDDENAIELEAPILPGGVEVRDADFDLGIGTLITGDLAMSDLRFQGSFRDGFLPDSSFGFRLGEAAFEGATSVDLRTPPHNATFEFGSRGVDVGRLLSHLGVAKGVEASAGALRIEVRGEGATLAELLRESDMMARLEDASWRLRDPNSDRALEIALARGELTSPQGDEPIRLVAEGSLQGIPARVSMQTEELSFFRKPEGSIPVDLSIEMAGATLEVSSAVSLPIERSELELSLSLTGESLADASGLFDYELPTLGPYRIGARMQLTLDDYRVPELEVAVGQSRLRGSGRLDTRGQRTRIEVDLSSERVQLDDFAVLLPDLGPDAEQEETAEPATSAMDDVDVETIREFWSPEGLLGFDGRLSVRVRQVLSGAELLGSGELVATLRNGKLTLDPLHIELPGGFFDLRTEYAYTREGVSARIRANTENFDYGVLARRVDPDTVAGGWARLDIDIAGEAPVDAGLLAHASGHLDFLVAPEDIDTNVFDLWAVSLVRLLIPFLDSGSDSTLNCAVGRFALDDGLLEERSMLIDTTGMVVTGDANVDFRKERFRALLTPQAKRPQMFSLEPRISVSGDFSDFHLGVPPEEVIATLVRFVTSAVVAPIQFVFESPLPADGTDTCLRAWEQPREPPAP